MMMMVFGMRTRSRKVCASAMEGDGGDKLNAAGAAESPSLAQLSAVLVEHDGLGRSKVHALGQASVGIGKYVDKGNRLLVLYTGGTMGMKAITHGCAHKCTRTNTCLHACALAWHMHTLTHAYPRSPTRTGRWRLFLDTSRSRYITCCDITRMTPFRRLK